ncbi:MAG: hypothetical protein MZW92_50405 [Comamonadaceae bacterium]|nr:hypothetical protein [Comamonadaceae bacterium]
MALGLLPAEGQSLILAGALISIAAEPAAVRRDRAGAWRWMRERSRCAAPPRARATTRWRRCPTSVDTRRL